MAKRRNSKGKRLYKENTPMALSRYSRRINNPLNTKPYIRKALGCTDVIAKKRDVFKGNTLSKHREAKNLKQRNR